MMFELKLTFSILLVSLFYYTSCSASESHAKQSMMEYMNDFFTQDNSDFKFSSHAYEPKNELENQHYRFSQNGTAPGAAAPAPATSNITAGANNGIAPPPPTMAQLQTIVMQDWLLISSSLFQNLQVFPPVQLPDGRKVSIRVDRDKFRLNDAFTAARGPGTPPPSIREFWFRLSGLNLYYTSYQQDINILGAIAIKEITKTKNSKATLYIGNNATYCFSVKDSNFHQWKICSFDKTKTQTWYCLIQTLLGTVSEECNAPPSNVTVVTVEKKITQPIIIVPTPSKFCNEDWNYQKMGDDWDCDCKEGKEQSPIDLPSKQNAIDSPVKPFFQYDKVSLQSPVTTIDGYQTQKSAIQFQFLEGALKLIYHKIGKVVTLDGAIYFAQEIIFHTPAEHTVNGKTFDMEIQIVHYGQTVGDIAKQVSLSFLVEKAPGVYNQFVDDFDIFDLPNPTDTKKNLKYEIYLPKIFFDKKEEDNSLPYWKPFSFYTYQGSLSFPPCTENTINYVAAKPIRLGSTAIALFTESLRVPDMMDQATGNVLISNWNTISNRKIQPTNGRPVFYYDHEKYCGPDRPEPRPVEEGHYEKVKTVLTKYFYVNKDVPSGVPQSFVVSKAEATGDAAGAPPTPTTK
jgi:carbonic anhydrase